MRKRSPLISAGLLGALWLDFKTITTTDFLEASGRSLTMCWAESVAGFFKDKTNQSSVGRLGF